MDTNKNNKRGGLVGKLLVAAMAGALAGGTMVGCKKEEAPADKPAEVKKDDTAGEGAAKPTEPAKTEGEKAEGAACSGEGKCGGDKAEGEKKEGAACGSGSCGGEKKEAAE